MDYKKIFIPIFTLWVLSLTQCTNPQQRAEQVAFTGACPKYGFFEPNEIRKLLPSSSDDITAFYPINEKNNDLDGSDYLTIYDYRVAIKTYDGKISHIDAKKLIQNISDIDTKYKFDNFQDELHEICGKDAKPFAQTKYEQIEESKQKVENLKNSPTWKKALSQSAEFDLGDKGKQILLAFLNSKDNNALNKIHYKASPIEETEDRKIWNGIKKKKNIFISRDKSAEKTFFFSEDYDVKSQTYPVYFEQGVTFGSSGMIEGDGIYIPRILSEKINLKMSPDLATSLGDGKAYNLDVIFSYSLKDSTHSYYYVNDNGLEIVLNEEKANLIKQADPFTFRSLSKRTGTGKTIHLKPLYYIFSIPEEDIIITNVK